MAWDSPKGSDEVFEQLVLVFCREQRLCNDQLVDYAPEGPHVDSVIILVAQQDFWRSVVPTLHVEKPFCTVFARSSEVNNFNLFVSLVCKQHVFRLHVAVNYSFVLHVLQSLNHLKTNKSQLFFFKNLRLSFVATQILKQVKVQLLKNYYYMLTKLKVV